MPAEWASDHRPRLRREIEQHAALDLVALDDAALFLHLEDLKAFYARCLQLHFTLFIPHTVGLYELAVACEELLGWDLQKTIGLLQGLSNTSTASTDELAALARRAGQRIATRELLEARTPDILKRLDDIDPPVAKELRQYLQFWGLRPIGPEAGCPTVADQPHLVADLIADLLSDDGQRDLSAARVALVEEARTQLTGSARQRFDAALAYAERVYPLREDNVLLTDQLPTGLLRRVALEAGRRLVSLGLLGRAEDAVMLTADELREALRTRLDVRRLVSRRKAEHAWVRANPGPMTYGPEPGKAPDLRGLPAPARRINRALLWMMEHELTAPPKANGNAIVGIGVSSGVYRGRVRVIRTARPAAHAASGRGAGVSDDVGRLDDGVSTGGCDRRRHRQRVVAYGDCRSRVRTSGRRCGGECHVQPGRWRRGDGRWDPRRGHPLLTRAPNRFGAG